MARELCWGELRPLFSSAPLEKDIREFAFIISGLSAACGINFQVSFALAQEHDDMLLS